MKKTGMGIAVMAAALVLTATVLLLLKQPQRNEPQEDIVYLPDEEVILLEVAPMMSPDVPEEDYVWHEEIIPETDSREFQVYPDGNQETIMNYDSNRVRDQYEVLLLPQQDEAVNDLGILFSYPVEGAGISNSFGSRTHPVTGEVTFHLGIDFAAEEGTPIAAVADGKVIKTGNDMVCGNYIVLLHENGDATYYAHCSDITALEGESVKRGEQIATVGNTGNATGPHVHFAVSRNGDYIEPEFED